MVSNHSVLPQWFYLRYAHALSLTRSLALSLALSLAWRPHKSEKASASDMEDLTSLYVWKSCGYSLVSLLSTFSACLGTASSSGFFFLSRHNRETRFRNASHLSISLVLELRSFLFTASAATFRRHPFGVLAYFSHIWSLKYFKCTWHVFLSV